MPLMPLVAMPVTASTAAEIRPATGGKAQTISSALNLSFPVSAAPDYLVEAPIQFVPGLEAHPSREAASEPTGSGPFGF